MKNEHYTKLDKVENHYGFEYQLIERTDKKCLYAQTKGGKTYGYEIFKTRIIKNSFKNNELQEKYPGHEEFGKRAWYITNLTQAKERYNKL